MAIRLRGSLSARVVFFLCGFSATGMALAVDGVLEINQACAQVGCFPGDTAGFPVTLAAPGSYRLTGNLNLTSMSASTPAIVISSSAVSLDLGGFEMVGPTSCTGSGAGISCTPADPAGYGVELQLGSNGVTVRNGTIRGFASSGIGSAGKGTRITGITAFHNETDGIATQEYAVVTDCIAFENGSDGFDVDTGSVVENVVAYGNGLDGVEVDGLGSVVNNSTARDNGSRGFNLTPFSKFGTNVSIANALPDNCGGGICTPLKRYYLTTEAVSASQPLTACDAGFHMAALWEIHDMTQLAYDYVRGMVMPDSGRGPPQRAGWVRTGAEAETSGGSGTANCAGWTSILSFERGTLISPKGNWTDDPLSGIDPWRGLQTDCDVMAFVWCVED